MKTGNVRIWLDWWLTLGALRVLVCVGVQPLNEIEEVNMFKDDNTVVHFRRP